MNNPVKQGCMSRSRPVVMLVLIVLAISILTTVLVSTEWISERNEHRAREFVQKVVESINQQTDYYKQHCRKDAIEKIEENIYTITDNYEVKVVDFEWAYYEYHLTFNGTNKFYVSVMRTARDDFILVHFRPIL